MARLTAEDEAAVPPDILKAYKDVDQYQIYVCPRTALKTADHRLSELREKIRLRYRPDFDVLREDEEIVSPTHCPPPKSLPDFEKHVKAYEAAVRRLDEAVSRHPSPVNEELAQEDAATRFLILKVLNRFVAGKDTTICINGTLPGVNAQDLAELKKETVEANAGPVGEDYHARLNSVFFSNMTPDPSPRRFDATLQTWGKWRVRPATFDECSRHLTYRIRRPLIRNDQAILSGINVRSDGSLKFTVIAEKSYEGWALVYYSPYGGFSERPVSTTLARVPPGEAADNFYILE